jgi:hypothetical protein
MGKIMVVDLESDKAGIGREHCFADTFGVLLSVVGFFLIMALCALL